MVHLAPTPPIPSPKMPPGMARLRRHHHMITAGHSPNYSCRNSSATGHVVHEPQSRRQYPPALATCPGTRPPSMLDPKPLLTFSGVVISSQRLNVIESLAIPQVSLTEGRRSRLSRTSAVDRDPTEESSASIETSKSHCPNHYPSLSSTATIQGTDGREAASSTRGWRISHGSRHWY